MFIHIIRNLLIIVLQTLPLVSVASSTYYVRSDFSEGDQSARNAPGFREDGLSDATAFDSLDDVRRISRTLKPGDRVLFKRGSAWTGDLFLQNVRGEAENPVLFSDYGDPSQPAPYLNGDGKPHTVHIKNCHHTVFENFKISNKREGEPNARGEGSGFRGGRRYGVFLEANAGGDVEGMVLRNNEICEVYGTMNKANGPQGGGAGLGYRGAPGRLGKKGRFNGLLIEGNHIHTCVRNGVWGVYDYRQPNHHYHQNVVFRHNLIEKVPGDGLIIWGCEGAVVEYNIFRDFTPLTHHPANAAIALWSFKSKDTLFQHNAVTDHLAEHDGQAYDVDFDSINTVFQYNYSADNIGGFALLIGAEPSDSSMSTHHPVFRYNLSINDGFRVHSTVRQFANWAPLFHFSGYVENTLIHNNTFYLPPKPPSVKKDLLSSHSWPNGQPDRVVMRDNVFFGTEDQAFSPGVIEELILDSNLYYRITPPEQEIRPLIGDAEGGNDLALLLTDPLTHQGSATPAPGVPWDFFGNPVREGGVGVYAGEADQAVQMPQRLVESDGYLEITRDLTQVTLKVVDLLKNRIHEESHADLPAGGLSFPMAGHRDGIYFAMVSATGLEDPIRLKFVKVDPLDAD